MTGAMILIVEDDSQVRRFVRAALERDGLRVAEAQSRREGLIEAGRCRPDLVILDLGLPDGDGADFVADFRAWSSASVPRAPTALVFPAMMLVSAVGMLAVRRGGAELDDHRLRYLDHLGALADQLGKDAVAQQDSMHWAHPAPHQPLPYRKNC